MIDRTIEPILKSMMGQYPVVTVTGPRQSGKTTLCRKVSPDMAYVNLESPDTRQFAISDPREFLSRFPEGAIIDEIQRVPDLVSYIQPMVDERQAPGQFILTGSQQLEVSNTINQSLAGRTALIRLLPLSVEELVHHGVVMTNDQFLLRGFYPRIYDQGLNPTQALGDYLETYVERDIRQLAAIRDLSLFEKFIRLCAGRVGQILNLHGLANDVGVSHTTARSWITILEAGYIVFLLQPWFRNVSKRLIKSPKLYFYDVGLASYLLGLENEQQVGRDPLRGNLFENMVVIEVLKYRFHRGQRSNLNFYRDSGGNEVDLVLGMGNDVYPLEIKAGTTISPDYFKGLKAFARLFPEKRSTAGLIYGGDDKQFRSDVSIYPVIGIDDLLNSVV